MFLIRGPLHALPCVPGALVTCCCVAGVACAGAGRVTYDGKLQAPFTAHPKVDPATGIMYAFGYVVSANLTSSLFQSLSSLSVISFISYDDDIIRR
jgi:Retinal pigment epithelial membrane protein